MALNVPHQIEQIYRQVIFRRIDPESSDLRRTISEDARLGDGRRVASALDTDANSDQNRACEAVHKHV